jgi:uncharacterized tellurite resistance protein B-like protein
MMNIDTVTIRRLRDALLASGREKDPGHVETGFPQDDAGRKQAALLRVAPFVETMYLMMAADEELCEAEEQAVRGALKVLTHGMLDDASLELLLADCEAMVQEQGVQARLQAVGARVCADRTDRETAFSLAAAIAMADNKLVNAESLLVDSIAEWYGISGRRCAEILQQFDNS